MASGQAEDTADVERSPNGRRDATAAIAAWRESVDARVAPHADDRARLPRAARRGHSAKKEWRIVYYIGEEVVAVLEVFAKTTRATPDAVIAGCRRRLAEFRRVAEDK